MSIFHGCIFVLCLAAVALAVIVAQEEEECKPVRCGHGGPIVRFPFWLEGHQPKRCGYPHPDFQLSCSYHSNNTQLQLIRSINISSNINERSVEQFPITLKFSVLEIDYTFQRLNFSFDNKSLCLPTSPPRHNVSSNSPPPLLNTRYPNYMDYLTVWNCSSSSFNYYDFQNQRMLMISCLSGGGNAYKVFAQSLHFNYYYYDTLKSCEKMYDVDSFTMLPFPEDGFQIFYWSTPSCGECEAQGMFCRLKKKSNNQTECFGKECEAQGTFCRLKKKSNNQTECFGKKHEKVVVAGILVLVLAVSLVLYVIVKLRTKKEDQKKIEKFLDDYRALTPSRFSYADVKKITDNFKDKLGEGGYGIVYKGNLCSEKIGNINNIPVAVKVLHNFKGNNNNNGEEFVNEVGTIGTIHHVNVVRLIGYCADGCRGALLYEFLPNGSLERLLSSRKLISKLGNWVKLRDIAIGVAKGLDYLHQGCNQRILHFDIKPQNILLDQNFNPKVSDFGLAKLCSKDQSAVSMTAARGTIGYIAPEVFSRNFGNVSYKSDVYSFGMLLVDMVGGRKTIKRREIGEREEEEQEDYDGTGSEMYFPEWMYKKLEQGEEINIQINNNKELEEEEEDEVVHDEENVTIFKKLAMVGLWCIQWCPAARPSMKVAIQMLEGENLPPMPPNPFGTASRSTMQNAFMTSIPEEIHELDINIA